MRIGEKREKKSGKEKNKMEEGIKGSRGKKKRK